MFKETVSLGMKTDSPTFILGFLSMAFRNHRAAGEGRSVLTLLYHFITITTTFTLAQMITAEISPLRIASDWTGTGNLYFPSASC